jgi:hypothetical protein
LGRSGWNRICHYYIVVVVRLCRLTVVRVVLFIVLDRMSRMIRLVSTRFLVIQMAKGFI